MANYKFAAETSQGSVNPDARDTDERGADGQMADEEVQRLVRAALDDASQLVDDELTPYRDKASNYYAGERFGNEQAGRSQVIITELRDTVLAIKPSLLRIFTAPQSVVEFVPRTQKGVPAAKQATDAVNYIFSEDSAGFLKMNAVLDDGLIRALGIFKWGWEDGRKQAMSDTGVSREALEALVARDDVEPTALSEPYEGPEGAEVFDVEYTVQLPGRVRIWTLPQEEFLFNRECVETDETALVAHRTSLSKGDLVAMGYSREDIDEFGGDDSALKFNTERISRRTRTSPNQGDDPELGWANQKVLYVEAFMRIDVDGDGVAELRKVCSIGPTFHVLHTEPAEDVPFAIFTPIPEPHTLIGQSMFDLTGDLQLTKSTLVRSMLDSLALSIFPRVAFIEGAASVEDILNTEIGAPIRTRRENAVMPIKHEFAGAAAMPVLDYFGQVAENRTGRDKGSMGLDADALQSSSKGAVTAAVTASQERTEVLARLFAEQALKPLFLGIYRLLVKHRPAARLMRLRGEYVTIDTMSWEADLDATVNVALGTGLPEQRIAALAGLAAKQEAAITQFGPDNPIFGLPEYRETLARMLELSGFRDITSFIKAVPPGWTPPDPGPPPPSPEEIIAKATVEVERMKVEKDLQIKEAELVLKKQAQEFEQHFKVAQLASDNTLKRYQIDAQWNAKATEGDLERDMRAQEAELSAMMDVARMAHERTTADADREAASAAAGATPDAGA